MDDKQRRRDNMQRRVPGALLDGEFDNEEEEMMLQNQARQERMRMLREAADDGMAGGGDLNDPNNLGNVLDFEDARGPLSVWLKKPDVIKSVERQFNQFLRHYKDDQTGNFIYEDKIHEMCQNNK